jgi:nicotinate-nucleotide pyrophosphorylase (carboxylating)
MELDSSIIDPIVRSALREDIGAGDLTTRAVIDRDGPARARIVAGTDALVAGLDLVERTFRHLDPDLYLERLAADGDAVRPGTEIARLRGKAGALLSGERTALNFLQFLSGIATRVAAYVRAGAGRGAVLLDTRKTTPGLRLLEKYAVRVGGAANHRLGLYDGILIKENHKVLAGGIGEAVRRARQRRPGSMPIEVEVESLQEFDEAVQAGADIVLLDNLTPDLVRQAVQRKPETVLLEASGGITPDNVADYADTGVDRISAGGLVHSATWVDFSMEIEGWEAV